MKKQLPKHLIIPDTQIKPGVPIDHMRWAGEYIAEKKPDRIIWIGDGADMESLSVYDVGKKSFEGRSYKADIDAFQVGLQLLMKPIIKEIAKGKWAPKSMDYTLGNHENRIHRAINSDRKLCGLISINDLGLREFGWNVHPFLKVIVRDGVAYSHYFTSGVMGKPVSSARALVSKRHQSACMGHVQRTEIDMQYNTMGQRITGIFLGTFYQHDEDYRDPQSNLQDYHCLWMLHNVNKGVFDPMIVPLHYLRDKYKK